MIDHAVRSVRRNHFYFVIHQVGRKLGGRSSTVYQPPYDPVILALPVHLDDADGILRLDDDVAEIFAAPGHKKIFVRKLRDARADRLPLLRLEVLLYGFHFLRLDAVG